MKNFLLFNILIWASFSFAQADLQLVNIGDFTTTDGNVIKDCRIGYRTVGKLNDDKSNVVLWPTWFGGTSNDIITDGLPVAIDTTGLYIIIVDALANGVSSSPSNTPNFPKISIRDMVNSQYDLLVNHLGIEHVHIIMGISLGGTQTFEWLVAYPEFMDKAIPITGTPKPSFYDIHFNKIQLDLLEEAGSNEKRLDFANKKAYDIFKLNIRTPSYITRTQSLESPRMLRSGDYLANLRAIIQHDIYSSSKRNLDVIKDVIKAEVLVIVSQQDHIVSPVNPIAFAKVLNYELLELTGDCGHLAPWCESEKIKKAVSVFLEK
jgi:homoserine O-acetyltransferase